MKLKNISLTEWIIIIAIIAIAIALAVPYYQSYTSKKMMAQVNTLLQKQFDMLADRLTNGNTQPLTLDKPLPVITSLVSTPTSTGGTVIVHFAQKPALNKAFEPAPVIATYVATKNNEIITWSCGQLSSTGTIDRADRAVITTNFLTRPQCS